MERPTSNWYEDLNSSIFDNITPSIPDQINPTNTSNPNGSANESQNPSVIHSSKFREDLAKSVVMTLLKRIKSLIKEELEHYKGETADELLDKIDKKFEEKFNLHKKTSIHDVPDIELQLPSFKSSAEDTSQREAVRVLLEELEFLKKDNKALEQNISSRVSIWADDFQQGVRRYLQNLSDRLNVMSAQLEQVRARLDKPVLLLPVKESGEITRGD